MYILKIISHSKNIFEKFYKVNLAKGSEFQNVAATTTKRLFQCVGVQHSKLV